MQPLNDSKIRACFVNASRKEVSDITLPDLTEVRWDRLDYLGWRDRKIARRAYVIVQLPDRPVGIMLRQADASPARRAQCSWCQDVQLPNDVVLYTARLAGPAGRKGDVLGSLMCADFECSTNVRKQPVSAYLGFDVEAARLDRIASLQERAAAFATNVLRDAGPES